MLTHVFFSSVVCSGLILELHGEAWTRVCWNVELCSSSAPSSRIHAAAPNQSELLVCLQSPRSVTVGSHVLHLSFIAKVRHTIPSLLLQNTSCGSLQNSSSVSGGQKLYKNVLSW